MKKFVVLTFDDACASHAKLAAPLLKKLKFNATFFVCEFPGVAPEDSLTYPEIAKLHRQGFEIGNHTLTHTHLSDSSKSAGITAIRKLNDKLAAQKLPCPVSFAYPGGTVPEDSAPLKKCRIKYARTTVERPWTPEDDLLHIPAFPVHGEDDTAFLQALETGNASAVPVLVYHGLPDNAHFWVNTPPETFIRQMNYLKQHDYTVLSLAEGAAHLARRRRRTDAMLTKLFAAIIPEAIGSEYIAARSRREKIHALANHFRRRQASAYCRETLQQPYNEETAAKGLAGSVTVINIPHTFAGGRFDYLFNPTLQGTVNNEWLWQLNRFYWWHDMAKLYAQKQQSKYAAGFNQQLRDWMEQIDIPERFNSAGSAWRTIEAGIRMMGSWQFAFEAFRTAPEFSDENLCLMLYFFLLHNRHLMKNRTQGNWMLMEMAGAYNCAVHFPEFKSSKVVRKRSAAILANALMAQILPDGLQNELSPDYHFVTLHCASLFTQITLMQGSKNDLPAGFLEVMKNAVLAPIALTAPNLTQPRTNDCYTILLNRMTGCFASVFPDLPEVQWVETNRAAGSPPADKDGNSSRLLPYSGFAAMRSSWDADANYLCFDFGPLGRGHWHWDKLNVNIYAGDEELIHDDGGGQYELSSRRTFARSAANHNTVLVDDLGQYREKGRNIVRQQPLIWHSTAAADYAKASYTEGFGEKMAKLAVHTREVLFLKPGIFCIADTLTSRDGKTHAYDLLWQLDTTRIRRIKKHAGAVISDFGRKYDIALLPLNTDGLTTETFSGVTKPEFCGWFIGRNDLTVHPATTVKMRVRNRKRFRFVTLLIPVKAGDPLPEVTPCGKNLYRITAKDQQHIINIAKLDSNIK